MMSLFISLYPEMLWLYRRRAVSIFLPTGTCNPTAELVSIIVSKNTTNFALSPTQNCTEKKSVQIHRMFLIAIKNLPIVTPSNKGLHIYKTLAHELKKNKTNKQAKKTLSLFGNFSWELYSTS